jgi:hypothetical protein
MYVGPPYVRSQTAVTAPFPFESITSSYVLAILWLALLMMCGVLVLAWLEGMMHVLGLARLSSASQSAQRDGQGEL